MAVADIKRNIVQILKTADSKTRAELSRGKIECYVYKRKYILEWCKWSANQVGINKLKKSILTKMANKFFDVLVAEFKKSNEPFHFQVDKTKEVVITKVSKTTASREAPSGREKKATLRAKTDALDVLKKEAKVTIGSSQQRNILSGMYGHHGGPTKNYPKTTLKGMVAVRDNMPESERARRFIR